MADISSKESVTVYNYSHTVQVKSANSNSIIATSHEVSSQYHYSPYYGLPIGIVFIVVTALVYFLPSIIALKRKHRNTVAIFVLNLFLGWSFFGWLAALIWSLLKDKDSLPEMI